MDDMLIFEKEIVKEPTDEDFRKANKVIKRTLWKYITSNNFDDRDYYGRLVDQQVAFFCNKFDVTPKKLFLYF